MFEVMSGTVVQEAIAALLAAYDALAACDLDLLPSPNCWRSSTGSKP